MSGIPPPKPLNLTQSVINPIRTFKTQSQLDKDEQRKKVHIFGSKQAEIPANIGGSIVVQFGETFKIKPFVNYNLEINDQIGLLTDYIFKISCDGFEIAVINDSDNIRNISVNYEAYTI